MGEKPKMNNENVELNRDRMVNELMLTLEDELPDTKEFSNLHNLLGHIRDCEVATLINDEIDIVIGDQVEGILPPSLISFGKHQTVTLRKSAFLSKSQAARLLDQLLIEYVAAHGLKGVNLDSYGLISENVRNVMPMSSVKTGKRRGNRLKWGELKHCRSTTNRILIVKSDLIDFFYNGIAPQLMKQAA